MKNLTLGLILVMISYGSLPVMAAPSLYELDQKEAVLHNKMSRLDQLELGHGTYTLVRDQYYYGPNGSQTLVDHWNRRIFNWTVSWQQSVAIMKRLDNFGDPGNRQAMKADLDAKTLEINAILNETYRVYLRISEGRELLKRIPAFSGTLLDNPGTEEFIAHFNYRVERLRQNFDNLEQVVHFDFIGLSMRLNNLARDMFIIQMDKAALSFPELYALSEELSASLRAEDLILPYFVEVLKFADDAQFALIDNRFFAGKDSLRVMQKVAFQRQQIIDSSDLPDHLKQWGIQKIQDLVNERTNRFLNMSNAMSPHQFTIAYFTAVLNRTVNECRKTGESRYAFDCLLLRELQRLVKFKQGGGITVRDFSAVKELDEDTLRYLESSLDQVMTNRGVQEVLR